MDHKGRGNALARFCDTWDVPGNHKSEDDSEEDAGGIVLRSPPPDDIELPEQQQELLPGAPAVGRVEVDRLAALLWL